jgi:hypothetical protein
MTSIATMAVNPVSQTTMKKMDYLMEAPGKLKILRKNTEVEDPMLQDEVIHYQRGENIFKFIINRSVRGIGCYRSKEKKTRMLVDWFWKNP